MEAQASSLAQPLRLDWSDPIPERESLEVQIEEGEEEIERKTEREQEECIKRIRIKRRRDLLWFIGIYALILIIIAVAAGLAVNSTDTKEAEVTMFIFFSTFALVLTTFGAYYFCVAYFAPLPALPN